MKYKIRIIFKEDSDYSALSYILIDSGREGCS